MNLIPRFLLILIPFILLLFPEWLLMLPIIDLDGEGLSMISFSSKRMLTKSGFVLTSNIWKKFPLIPMMLKWISSSILNQFLTFCLILFTIRDILSYFSLFFYFVVVGTQFVLSITEKQKNKNKHIKKRRIS